MQPIHYTAKIHSLTILIYVISSKFQDFGRILRENLCEQLSRFSESGTDRSQIETVFRFRARNLISAISASD